MNAPTAPPLQPGSGSVRDERVSTDGADSPSEGPRRPSTLRVRHALLFAATILMGPVSRRPVQARGDEARRPLSGDELLPAAKVRWTNAITIRATAGEVWPWLVQLGCRRAGWYSYDGLDNGGIPSAEEIVPALQHVEVGDLFAWTLTAEDGFIVEKVEPEHALVIGGQAGELYRVTMAFVLEPVDAASTRLLARSSADYDRFTVRLFLAVYHLVHFAMQRRQLLNLRRRVERAARATAGPA
jgi:hypothetical protein